MAKRDFKYIVIFVILIVLIILTLIFSSYKNRPLNNIDRKIEYIFNGFTYDEVLNASKNLFLNSIKLVKNNFDYEKNINNEINYYSINDFTNCKKILNYSLISNTLKTNTINKYLNEHQIIEYKNEYYIVKNDDNINSNYIGSIIDINNYGNYFVNFKSTNYYCSNSNYIGLLDSEPNCDYTKSETNFTVSLENNLLKINNIEEIAKILQ